MLAGAYGWMNKSQGGVFSPAQFFAAGEKGAWFDPSDLSTLFQDSAGTTPVTAVGQPVGKINDKSGRGNHALQTVSTSRPLLQQDGSGRYYLAFDGSDDFLVTGTSAFGATTAVSVFVGFRKVTTGATSVICESSANPDTTNGSFNVFTDASNLYYLGARGTSTGDASYNQFPTVPKSLVVTGKFDLSKSPGSQISGRFNGAAYSPTGSFAGNNSGSGTFSDQPIYLGRRGNGQYPLQGNIYQLVIRAATTTATDVTSAESYINQKTGAY